MPAEELLAGTELAGYRIEGLAGRGGMGVVYRATDIALQRPVALKLILDQLARDDGFRRRFKRESRLAASIRHPHVITVFAAGEADGVLYIAMDYIDGEDLKTLLNREGRLAASQAALVVSQVASALDAAHAKTLVHRDVKPGNVLVTGKQDALHAYLTDFGLTKDVSSQSAMTQAGMFVGTLDYIAPEQIEGGQVDARADVYALGCVLYEALTGLVPFPRDSTVGKMFAHLHDDPPPLPDAPPAFEGIVQRAMAKRPDDRYPSAGDLGRAALAGVEGTIVTDPERSVATGVAAPGGGAATGAASAAAPTEPALPARRRRRRRGPAAAGAALLVLAALALLVTPWGGDDGPAPLSKERYQDAVLDRTRAAAARMFTLERRIPQRLEDTKASLDAAGALAEVRRELDRTITGLDALTPPEEVADLHRRIIVIFRRARNDIADAGAAADAVKDRPYGGALKRFTDGLDELGPVGEEFRRLGYRRLAQQGDEPGS